MWSVGPVEASPASLFILHVGIVYALHEIELGD